MYQICGMLNVDPLYMISTDLKVDVHWADPDSFQVVYSSAQASTSAASTAADDRQRTDNEHPPNESPGPPNTGTYMQYWVYKLIE